MLARAVALHQAGDLEGAITAYRESLRLGPTSEAGSNLGAALAALGRYQEAIEAYRGALAMAPLDGRIRYNLALAHYKSADLPRAAEELEALHAQQPADVRATLLLADCRLQLGEPAAVEALLRPLAAARPDDRAVTYMLGMALVRNGKVQEGQRLVETLLRDGDSAEAQYLRRLGRVHGRRLPAGRRALLERAPEERDAAVAALVLRPGAPLHRRRGRGRAGLSRGPRREPERLRGEPLPRLAPRHPRSARRKRGRSRRRPLGLRPQSAEAKELVASLDSPGSAAASRRPRLAARRPPGARRRPARRRRP